jgi:hypothetical protein
MKSSLLFGPADKRTALAYIVPTAGPKLDKDLFNLLFCLLLVTLFWNETEHIFEKTGHKGQGDNCKARGRGVEIFTVAQTAHHSNQPVKVRIN